MPNKNVRPLRYFTSPFFKMILCECGSDTAAWIRGGDVWSWGRAYRGNDEPYIPDTLVILFGIPLAV